MKIWTGFSWLRLRYSGCPCEDGNESWGCVNWRRLFATGLNPWPYCAKLPRDTYE